jgi:HD domain-containing protein/GAF domain-containing protein
VAGLGHIRAVPRGGGLWESAGLRQSGYTSIVLERIVLHACTIFDADEVCVIGRELGARDDAPVLVQAAGVNPDLIGQRLPVHSDPLVAALACGRPLAIPGELWPSCGPETDMRATESAAVAPIWFGGKVRGALGVTHRREGFGFDLAALALLGDLAELVGSVLAHARGRQLAAADPRVEIDALVGALARIEAPGACAHGARVATVAHWLADDLGFGGPDRLELELAARLHDVGDLRMPFRLLRRRGPLSGPDLELLGLQPVWGAEMVARIPGLEAVSLIVRHCHERWDGGGYPDGLAGARIPLASRIIGLADTFASMTAPHPHGRGLDPVTALRGVDALAGTAFDPELTASLAGGVKASQLTG